MPDDWQGQSIEQHPNLIVRNERNGKNYNYYIKLFNDNSKTKSHMQVVKVMPDGSFYVTNHETNAKQLQKIIEGQVIYDLSSMRPQENLARNNRITNFQGDFNPDVNNLEVRNGREVDSGSYKRT